MVLKLSVIGSIPPSLPQKEFPIIFYFVLKKKKVHLSKTDTLKRLLTINGRDLAI